MDLHSLTVDLRQKRAVLRAADDKGVTDSELFGEAFLRVAGAAQPLFDWAHGFLPASARTPRDATLVAFEIDTIQRKLRLAYLAECAARSPVEKSAATPPALTWCDGDYDKLHPLLREAARTATRELKPFLVIPDELAATPGWENQRWEYFYEKGRDNWELGRAAPPLVRYLATAAPLAKNDRALVLGCGRGHEALLLAQLAKAVGAEVVAIDIAATATRLTREAAAAAELGDCLKAHTRDMFSSDHSEPLCSGSYQLILEHTCYCAIEPTRRDEYIATIHRLLAKNGRFIGLFYCHSNPGGPPYGSTIDDVRTRLLNSVSIDHEEIPNDSVLSRAAVEWLVDARRI